LAAGSIVLTGQTLIKTWNLKNTGTDRWPDGTKLVFHRGHRELLSAQEEFEVSSAEPGKIVSASVVLQTPVRSGTYESYFQLTDANRQPIADRIAVKLVVVVAEQKEDVKMEVEQAPQQEQKSSPSPSLSPSTVTPALAPPAAGSPAVKYGTQLASLAELGFDDDQMNKYLLDHFKGNVQQVVDFYDGSAAGAGNFPSD